MAKFAPVFWFTGLSGTGKTTLAEAVRDRLQKRRLRVLIIDGDVIRASRHGHLGFTPPEIKKNNCLITELCANSRNDFDAILVPIISPYAESRTNARHSLGEGFHEIYIKTQLSKLEDRDTKGLYGRARSGEIVNLIGVSSTNVYEVPEHPSLVIETNFETVERSATTLFEYCIKYI